MSWQYSPKYVGLHTHRDTGYSTLPNEKGTHIGGRGQGVNLSKSSLLTGGLGALEQEEANAILLL